MLTRLTQLCLFIAAALNSVAQDRTDFQSVSVTNTLSESVPLNLHREKPVLIIVLGTDCPITQKYVPTIEKLKTEFSDQLEIVGIFPKGTTVDEMKTFIEEYRITVPCYIDHTTRLVTFVNATVTPEAFLFDKNQKQLYSGAIDNWFYKLGSYRTKPTKHYLQNAIRSFIKGNVIETPRTEAIGCLISKPVSHKHH